MTNDQAAYKELKELEPNLAQQVLSLIPGESVRPGYESLASNRLMATIFNAPQKKIEVDYAEAILKYKDFVEVEYTANYIGSEVEVQVIRDGDRREPCPLHHRAGPDLGRGGRGPVRSALPADRTRLRRRGEDRLPVRQGLPLQPDSGRARGRPGQVHLHPGRLSARPRELQFRHPAQERASKEFTGAGRPLVVPDPAGPPGLGPLLLAYGAETPAAGTRERVPFKVGDAQLFSQTRKMFGAKDTIVLFVQPFGVTPGLKATGTLRSEFLREDLEHLTRTSRLADVPPTGVVDVQPLTDFPPGYYQVRVTLLDGQEKALAAVKENFEVSLAPSVPRPLVMAKIAAAATGADELLNTGIQLANKGDVAAALPKLAEAYARAPQRAHVAVAYAQALFRSSDHMRAKDVLRPCAEAENAPAEVPALLGLACQALEEYEAAAKPYTAYLVRFGANVDILNWLGTCYNSLGNTDEALKAWTKSLDISPTSSRSRPSSSPSRRNS